MSCTEQLPSLPWMIRVHVWRVRDEIEQSGGSEATESSRWALPRQVLEIPSLAVKNSQDRIYGDQIQSGFIWYSLGTPLSLALFVIKPEEYLISRLCYKLIEKWPWGSCGSLPVQKQSWRHCELYLLTSLQPTFTVFLLPSGYADSLLSLPFSVPDLLPALQWPAQCPQSPLPPLPAPPPQPCLRTYPRSPSFIATVVSCCFSLSMKPRPSSLPALTGTPVSCLETQT